MAGAYRLSTSMIVGSRIFLAVSDLVGDEVPSVPADAHWGEHAQTLPDCMPPYCFFQRYEVCSEMPSCRMMSATGMPDTGDHHTYLEGALG
jgi:hypothetical protein